MARPFVITTPNAKVTLDKQGKGKVSFTVSNETGKPLKAQIKAKPLNAAKEAWLTVTGEVEREFLAEGSQQITVEIAVPEGTTAGKFDFRIDVASVYNPEDEYAEGPTVAFEAPEIKSEAKKFPWWIVAVAAAVLIIGGGLTWFLRQPKNVNVPEEEARGEQYKFDDKLREQKIQQKSEILIRHKKLMERQLEQEQMQQER